MNKDKKDLKHSLRSKRLREIQTNDQNVSVFNTLSTNSPVNLDNYSSYQAYLSLDVPQSQIRSLCSCISKNVTNFCSHNSFRVPSDYDGWEGYEYRDNWIINGFFADGSDLSAGPGYLFTCIVGSKYCGVFDKSIGPAALAVMQTSKQINSYNDPGISSLGGSISKMIIDYFNYFNYYNSKKVTKVGLTEWKKYISDPFGVKPLMFGSPGSDDEYIYYIPPKESPLTFEPNITTSIKQGFLEVNIKDFIDFVVSNTSSVPKSEFQFTSFKSSDESIAEVSYTKLDFGIKIPTDRMTFKQSGTFTLSGTQVFYQSQKYNVAFHKKDFSITINVNIFD